MALARVCVDSATGQITMIVVPDSDAQLNDPAFTPKNCICADIPKTAYIACSNQLDILKAAQPIVAQQNPVTGGLVSAAIAQIDLNQ